MRPDTVPKINCVDQLVLAEIDHSDCASVRSGHTDSRVAVDGHECLLAIGRGDNFMSSNTSLHDGRNLPPAIRVNETKSLVAFVGD